MIGIDIIKISRVYDLHDDFPSKILSSKELEIYYSLLDEDHKARYLASRWAGKEAYIKASGDKSVDFRRISIVSDEDGRPHLYVDEEENGEISLSHDGYAIAMVIL